jgi:FMN phosphatase YigB (HAD superfamily)
MNSFLKRTAVKHVFVDWFGVLSTNYYWCVQYKNNSKLKEWCDCVFDDPEILAQWMRGKLTIEYLVDFRVKVDVDFVKTNFLKDMSYYKPDKAVLDSLNALFPNSKKYLVTDNIELFTHVLNNYEELQRYFSKFYLSNEVGLLKHDEPISLFDHIQTDLGLSSFEDCILIDDLPKNCEIFNRKGGRSILIG